MATINSDAPPRTIVNAIDARLITDSGVDVGAQNPLSISSDSIYSMDLDLDYCDNGGFSGTVSSYFDSLKLVNSDASATNPKSIKLWFNRPETNRRHREHDLEAPAAAPASAARSSSGPQPQSASSRSG